MTRPLAVDTSVAVPLVVQQHSAHQAVVRWWAGREVALSGHAAAETYCVRDARARDTYERIGVGVIVVA